MTHYDLLIVYTNGSQHVVRRVDRYRYDADNEQFVFEKNGYRGFVPKCNVKFFGRNSDYENLQ